MVGVGRTNGQLELFDAQTGARVAKVPAHRGRIKTILFALGGAALLTEGDENETKVWIMADLRLVANLRVPEGAWWHLAFSPDGRWVAFENENHQCAIFDTRDPAHLAFVAEYRGSRGTEGGVWHTDFSQDSRLLGTVSGDGVLRLWDLGSGKLLCSLRTGLLGSAAIRFLPEGKLATANDDGCIRLWDVATRQEILATRVASGTVWITGLRMVDDDTLQFHSRNGVFRLRAAPWSQIDASQ
jgi:WD40 repeat protein